MKWQTKNHIGETVTWYSEDVIERIRETINQCSLDDTLCMQVTINAIKEIIEKG